MKDISKELRPISSGPMALLIVVFGLISSGSVCWRRGGVCGRAVNEPSRSFTVPGEGSNKSILLVESLLALSQLRIY